MNLSPKYQLGDSFGSFTFEKALPIEELLIVLYELTHNPSGAKVMHLASSDRENLFCLSFRTLPENSNGVAHILEHTVLCGSKKFPVKDPFFSMSRRSLSTFMNAMTGSDFTCYPASSQIEKDFYNLLEVYLDAVFSPKLNEMSFHQEGHRLEFEKADDQTSPLLFKGVVFNEMKGSLSSPESRLLQGVMTNLTPDLTYAHNSGGDPREIPSLTYEQLKGFHQKFYHPSRALFFFYGDLPIEKHLEFIEKHALKGIKKLPDLPPIPHQRRFKTPRLCQMEYPSKDADLSKKTYTTFNWLTTRMENQQEILALALIESMLMETDASPLKMALLKSKLCTQADSFLDSEMSEIPYSITCYGTDPEDEERLQKVLFDALHHFAENQIDQKLLDAAIHQLEFSRLEIRGDFGPFGLTLFMRSALAKQNNSPPEQALAFYSQFERLRKQIKDPNYLPGLINKYFIDNPHFVRLIMKPKATLEEEERKAEKARLKQIKDSLSEKEKAKIVDLAKDLQNYQEKSEKKSVDSLPKLELGDIPKDVSDFPLSQEQQNQLSIFHHKCFTNHILYADLIFELPRLSLEDLPYLKLLTSLISELGVGERSYQENLDYINCYLGGFNASLQLYPQIETPSCLKPSFGFRGKALKRNVKKLFALFKDICHSPRFDETQRIKELILQIHTHQQSRLSQNALSYAIQSSLATFTPSAAMVQKLSGIDYFFFIRDLVKELDQKLPHLQKRLKELCSSLFHFNSPHLILSADIEERDDLASNSYFGLGELPSKPLSPFEEAKPESQADRSRGYVISTPVAFCAWGMKTCTALDPHAPALSVATYLLENTYLHQKIREQGGAYGSGARYDPLSGHFYFYSYRDPHIMKSFDAFKGGIEHISEGKFSNSNLEEAKLGFIQRSDKPVSPGHRALLAYSRFREGNSKRIRQEFRENVLSLGKKEIREAVEKNIQGLDGARVTFSNQDMIKKENQKAPGSFSIFSI